LLFGLNRPLVETESHLEDAGAAVVFFLSTDDERDPAAAALRLSLLLN
jgi:hypothetical protein